MTTPPTTDPGPLPPTPIAFRSRGDRFFSWTAGLGVVRSEGWIGGVAAGLAARLRVDPLIIRGVLVVAALFALPAILAYAVAWALLPDLDDRIVLRDALHGRLTAALGGVAVFAIVGLLPSPLLLLVTDLPARAAVLAVPLVLILVIAAFLVFLIVRASGRTPGEDVVEPRSASAATTGPDSSAVLGSGAEEAEGGAASATVASSSAVLAPASTAETVAAAPPPGILDDTDEMAQWRAQHAAWKEQDQLWRQQQQDAVRAAREQARRERQARAAGFSAAAAERQRVRRATNPRAPFAFIAAAIGVGVLAGTITALQHGGSLAPARGLFVAAAVLAVAMIIAGVVRRRSGFLAFLTALTLTGGAIAVAVPAAIDLHLGSYGISNLGRSASSDSAPFRQPWGDLSITLADTGRDGATYVDKRQGSTFIGVQPGVEVTVEVTTDAAAVVASGTDTPTPWTEFSDMPGGTVETLPDGRQLYRVTATAGPEPATTRHRVVIDQDAGYVELYLESPATPTEGDGQ
ncbi:PspC domain-containing protein [Microbacterium sp. TNHR37B]|uniref:PspC domain-containing protein n=1 Tax=Microbacterium sp. TNHR37B TaxID=1775956 RepID=UPI0007B28C28|nr:PspC domain-containing protein [Microbacterium sp. TNHR37B]KZE89220.1 hypothetical protein AVP41_02012 [Microbacterium sp. TNHR37B]